MPSFLCISNFPVKIEKFHTMMFYCALIVFFVFFFLLVTERLRIFGGREKFQYSLICEEFKFHFSLLTLHNAAHLHFSAFLHRHMTCQICAFWTEGIFSSRNVGCADFWASCFKAASSLSFRLRVMMTS